MNKEITLPADEKYIPAVRLNAGDITAIYEGGRIRYIAAAGTEIIHMIYSALRDENWTTIEPVIHDEKISRQDRSFLISYTATYQGEGIQYKAFYEIEGRADSSISFSMKGESLSTFKKRRIGLCTLQPIASCSGRDIEVLQPDGKNYSSVFPEFVSPFQPFLDIRMMKWIAPNEIFVEVGYEGDVFETEDQRNWSDNSFKTYSTPLSVPAPATVRPGDTVQQKVTVRVRVGGTGSRKAAPQKEVKRPLPKIGYARPGGGSLSSGQIALLKQIPFDHYKVQLDLSGDWKKAWSEAAGEAGQLHTTVELFLNFDQLSEEEVDAVTETLRPSLQWISSVLILSAHHETAPLDFFERAYERIKKSWGNILVGYGTNANFADINRNRPGNTACDFINFHLQPQVHMDDSRSIMENLGSHETLIRSAGKFAGGKPPACLIRQLFGWRPR